MEAFEYPGLKRLCEKVFGLVSNSDEPSRVNKATVSRGADLAALHGLANWIVFAILYRRVGFATQPSNPTTATAHPIAQVGEPLSVDKALAYSLGVMMLQKSEPRPLTNAASFAVLLQTILGPVHGALLVLAESPPAHAIAARLWDSFTTGNTLRIL